MIFDLFQTKPTEELILRDYQELCTNQTEKCWDAGKQRVALISAMASGKTSMGAWLIRKHVHTGGRALVICHMRKLVKQFRDSIESKVGLPVSLEMSGYKDEGYPVLCATVQTIAAGIARGRWRRDEFSLILMDEAHLAMAPQFQTVAKHFNQAKVLGVTATPHRGDGRDLRDFFDGWVELQEAKMDTLIQRGFLAPITIKKIPVKITLNGSGSGDFSDQECNHAIEPYLDSAADSIKVHADGRCGLTFLPLIATSQKFAQMLRERGIKAEHVDGEMDEEVVEGAIARLGRGEISMLTCSQLLGIGFDLPPINFICILRPTTSWTTYSQQVGRGLRTWTGSEDSSWPPKTDCVLLDPIFETERHNLLQTPASLICDNPEEVAFMKARMSSGEEDDLEMDLMSLRNEAVSAREKALAARLQEASDRKSQVIDAMDFFLGINNTSAAHFEPTKPWEGEKPTPAQINTLQRMGFDLNTGVNKGQATILIREILNRTASGKSSLDTVRKCAKLGHENPWQLTEKQAQEYLKQNE